MTIKIVLAFFSTLILTLVIRKIAIKKAIIDIPNERSSHKIPTPRGGGLAIVVVFYLYLLYLSFVETIEKDFFFLLLPGIIMSIVSFIDDVKSLSPKLRLVMQAFVLILVIIVFNVFENVQFLNLGFSAISSSVIIAAVILFLGIWFINLFNFMDGIDGYAGMEAITIIGIYYFLTKDPVLLMLIAIVLGFLVLNWQPAKIFMGDVGSTSLGYIVIVLAFHYSFKFDINFLTLMIPSSLFWFDATYTLIRRALNGEKLSDAHKKHAYQRLIQYGYSHQKVVIIGISINVVLFLFTYLSFVFDNFAILFFILSLFFLFGFVRLVNRKIKFI